MEKKINKHIYFSLLLCVAAICMLFASCKNEDTTPVITSIRMYNPSPQDTLLSTGNPDTDPSWSLASGKYVVIIGQNLQDVVGIKFNGVAATFNSALFSPNTAVLAIPSIVYSAIDETKLYTVEYATTTGSTTFSFKLGPVAPTLSAISNVFADPGDSVHVYGANLVLVKSFSYGGVPITSFKASADGSSIGFLMPNPAPTSGDVSVTAERGTATLKIVATPTITAVSNENASVGDSVYVYGTYLKAIQSFSFGGAAISDYTLSADGKSLGFVLSSPVQTGLVSVTTAFGSASTVYNVNNSGITDGMLANVEWGNFFGWGWWGGVSLTVNSAANSGGWIAVKPDFDGVLGTDNTMFISYSKTGAMKSGDGAAGDGFPIGENQWIPVANLSDPVDNWALKFEMSVAHPWNVGTLCFTSGFDGSYMARYEPWQVTAGFSTKGWQTVTIPLSSFRAEDTKVTDGSGKGKGASVASLTNLVGTTGKTSLSIYLHNFNTASVTTDFYAAFDNVRVVKIK